MPAATASPPSAATTSVTTVTETDEGKRARRRRVEHLVAGSFAGIFNKLMFQPIDLIKTRLQVQPAGLHYLGIIDGLRSVVKTEGMVHLYRGLGPSLLGSSMSWGSYFFFYNLLKVKVHEHQEIPITQRLNAGQHLGCAAVAGFTTALFTNPIWLLKTRLQLQVGREVSEGDYRGLIDAFRHMVREEGFLSLYRGMGPALMLVSNGALQFMAYEELKKWTLKYWLQTNDESKLKAQHFLAMGAFAKLFSSSLTYPLQVTKARLYQRGNERKGSMYNGILDVWRSTFRRQGLRGFYSGYLPSMMKV